MDFILPARVLESLGLSSLVFDFSFLFTWIVGVWPHLCLKGTRDSSSLKKKNFNFMENQLNCPYMMRFLEQENLSSNEVVSLKPQ